MGEPDSKQGDVVTVKIPRALAERISRRLQKSGFETVDAYMAFVMQQVVSEMESEDVRKAPVLSEAETASMERKLKDLGYA